MKELTDKENLLSKSLALMLLAAPLPLWCLNQPVVAATLSDAPRATWTEPVVDDQSQSEQYDNSIFVDYELQPQSEQYDNSIFVDYELQPEFPGGEQALLAFIKENLRNPTEDLYLKARVTVTFTILEDGSISNPEIMRSPSDVLSAEALRVVGLMPKWKPAKCFGKPKKIKYVLPIIFKFGEEEVKPESDYYVDDKKMPAFFGKMKPSELSIQGRIARVEKSEDGKSEFHIDTRDGEQPAFLSYPVYLDGKKMPDDFDMNSVNPADIDCVSVNKKEGAEGVYITLKHAKAPKPIVYVDGKKMPADFDVNSIESSRIDSMVVIMQGDGAILYIKLKK